MGLSRGCQRQSCTSSPQAASLIQLSAFSFYECTISNCEGVRVLCYLFIAQPCILYSSWRCWCPFARYYDFVVPLKTLHLLAVNLLVFAFKLSFFNFLYAFQIDTTEQDGSCRANRACLAGKHIMNPIGSLLPTILLRFRHITTPCQPKATPYLILNQILMANRSSRYILALKKNH